MVKWDLQTVQIHKRALESSNQSPSPRAEPFKQWLAQVWYERIQEINDPELSMQRMIATYEKKWYPKEWKNYFSFIYSDCYA